MFFSLSNSHIRLKGTWLRHHWFCCMYFCLPKIINSMYIEKLREMISAPRQITVGVHNLTAFLILFYISFRLVALLKISDILGLTVSFKFVNFSSQIFLSFILKYLLTLRLTLFRLPTLLWFGSCIHWIYSLLPLI